MRPFPVVSINVIAYNAQDYILETLDSIKSQTYQQIELIISDDASCDDTVKICQDWLQENKNRFIRTKLLTSNYNSGVAANCQRALNESQGDYRKGIGSDDILFPDAIEKYVAFVMAKPEVEIVFANEIRFWGDFNKKNFKNSPLQFRRTCFNKRITAKRQHSILTKMFIGCAPTAFISIKSLREVGGFNDAYLTEDGPLYMALTKHGYKLYYLDQYVLYRRIRTNSLSHSKQEDALLRNLVLRKGNKKLWIDCQLENSSRFWFLISKYDFFLASHIIKYGNTRKSWKCLFFYYIYKISDPYRLYYLVMTIRENIASLFDKFYRE